MTEHQTYLQPARGQTKNTRAEVLWKNYCATRDEGIRNELVLLYMRLVEIIARKMYHMFCGVAQLEDIIGNGTLALIGAIESFDPDRGVKFETYASLRIRGSVIDYIRSQDWVPRTAREKAKKLEASYLRLRETLGREPTREELSENLQISAKAVDTILSEVHASNILSLEEMIAESMESGFNLGEAAGAAPCAKVLEKELRHVLAEAIDSLTEKERLVVTLVYYEELKIKEIAEVMGITPARVCQLHTVSLMKVKAKLKDYLDD